MDIKLHEAAERGNADEIARLIADGHNPNERDPSGFTALHRATNGGHVQAVMSLIKADAHVETTTHKGWTSLHFAANSGRADLVEILVRAGSFVDRTEPTSGYTALHLACLNNHAPVVAMLMSLSADANFRSFTNSDTALHLLAERNFVHSVEAMFDFQTSPMRVVNDLGYTPLHCAALHGHAEMCALLATCGSPMDEKCKVSRRTSLHLATLKSHADAISALCNGHADPTVWDYLGYTPLHMAALRGDLRVLCILLKHRVPEHLRTANGDSLLHCVIRGGSGELTQYVLTSRIVSVDVLGAANRTVLFEFGLNANTLPHLIEGKIDFECADAFGYTPLQFFCQAIGWASRKLVNPDPKDGSEEEDGESGIKGRSSSSRDMAARRKSSTDSDDDLLGLLNKRRSVSSEVKSSRSELHPTLHKDCVVQYDPSSILVVVKLLLEGKANVNNRGRKGRSPLHTAVMARNAALVRLLIKHGANPKLELPDNKGVASLALTVDTDGCFDSIAPNWCSALMRAATNADPVTLFRARGLIPLRKVELSDDEEDEMADRKRKLPPEDPTEPMALQDAGQPVDVNVADGFNTSPLIAAAWLANERAVQIFLHNGAVHGRDLHGRSAMFYPSYIIDISLLAHPQFSQYFKFVDARFAEQNLVYLPEGCRQLKKAHGNQKEKPPPELPFARYKSIVNLLLSYGHADSEADMRGVMALRNAVEEDPTTCVLFAIADPHFSSYHHTLFNQPHLDCFPPTRVAHLPFVVLHIGQDSTGIIHHISDLVPADYSPKLSRSAAKRTKKSKSQSVPKASATPEDLYPMDELLECLYLTRTDARIWEVPPGQEDEDAGGIKLDGSDDENEAEHVVAFEQFWIDAQRFVVNQVADGVTSLSPWELLAVFAYLYPYSGLRAHLIRNYQRYHRRRLLHYRPLIFHLYNAVFKLPTMPGGTIVYRVVLMGKRMVAAWVAGVELVWNEFTIATDSLEDWPFSRLVDDLFHLDTRSSEMVVFRIQCTSGRDLATVSPAPMMGLVGFLPGLHLRITAIDPPTSSAFGGAEPDLPTNTLTGVSPMSQEGLLCLRIVDAIEIPHQHVILEPPRALATTTEIKTSAPVPVNDGNGDSAMSPASDHPENTGSSSTEGLGREHRSPVSALRSAIADNRRRQTLIKDDNEDAGGRNNDDDDDDLLATAESAESLSSPVVGSLSTFKFGSNDTNTGGGNGDPESTLSPRLTLKTVTFPEHPSPDNNEGTTIVNPISILSARRSSKGVAVGRRPSLSADGRLESARRPTLTRQASIRGSMTPPPLRLAASPSPLTRLGSSSALGTARRESVGAGILGSARGLSATGVLGSARQTSVTSLGLGALSSSRPRIMASPSSLAMAGGGGPSPSIGTTVAPLQSARRSMTKTGSFLLHGTSTSAAASPSGGGDNVDPCSLNVLKQLNILLDDTVERKLPPPPPPPEPNLSGGNSSDNSATTPNPDPPVLSKDCSKAAGTSVPNAEAGPALDPLQEVARSLDFALPPRPGPQTMVSPLRLTKQGSMRSTYDVLNSGRNTGVGGVGGSVAPPLASARLESGATVAPGTSRTSRRGSVSLGAPPSSLFGRSPSSLMK